MDAFKEKISSNKTLIQTGNIVLCFSGAVLLCFGVGYDMMPLISLGLPMLAVSIVIAIFLSDK